jgi:hypothetical protein
MFISRTARSIAGLAAVFAAGAAGAAWVGAACCAGAACCGAACCGVAAGLPPEASAVSDSFSFWSRPFASC